MAATFGIVLNLQANFHGMALAGVFFQAWSHCAMTGAA
jgi:hypothetical protein